MSTITNASIPRRLFGGALALALIAAVALLAVPLSAGLTQAQDGDPPATPTPTPAPLNVYDDPQPCGPGAETAFQPEPHEIHEGHFALFDAYWQSTTPSRGDDSVFEGGGLDNTGILHTNTCPPLVTKTTEPDPDSDEEGAEIKVTTLTASGIDIGEAIFHVLDDDKATVVSGTEDNGTADDSNVPQISLAEYPGLSPYADVGDQVWWLRLDDPDTIVDEDGEPINETSDLTLGFSTHRLSAQYWARADGSPPFRYMFELVRNPGINPADHPHFLTYRAPKANNEEAELVWDSAAPDSGTDMTMAAGTQIDNLQWIFTKPGTYEISVHLQGHVRSIRIPPPDAADDWEPISGIAVEETSEVKRYVIQVGSELDENEPPVFGVNLSVPENSPAGAPVGAPIPIFEGEADTFYYTLAGEGSEQFALDPTTDPQGVQIKVADGASLDYETKPSYQLTLSVTDRIDHESNPDLTIDDALAVRVALEDVSANVAIDVSNPSPVAGNTVMFTAVPQEFEVPGQFEYFWSHSSGVITPQLPEPDIFLVRHTEAATDTVSLTVRFLPEGGVAPEDYQSIHAEPVTVTWSSP